MTSLIDSLKSVVLTAPHAEATAAFYRDVLQLPLESEAHRGTQRHWAGPIGAQYFAIHEREGFWLPEPQPAAPTTIVSFTVRDLDRVRQHLGAHGVPVVRETKIGPMSFLAVTDPDGRYVCSGTPWPERKPSSAASRREG